MDFIYFLGRFHVLMLHLPVGILLVAIAFEVLAWYRKNETLWSTATILWAFGAVCAVATVVLGWMHSLEGGFDGSAVDKHKWYGVALALVSIAIWLARVYTAALYRRVAAATGIVVVFLLTMTGHYGGNITHGETFLVEYAPQPIRSLAGLTAEQAPRATVTDVMQADIYLDVVAPAMKRRCASCHNSNKRRGGFSLASFDEIMEGGENGPAVAPGSEDGGEILRRISLSPAHKDFMPDDGKTPLTTEETEVIRLWVNAGALERGLVKELSFSNDELTLISSVLGLENNDGDELASIVPVDPEVISQLESYGYNIRQLSETSPLLDIDVNASPGMMTDEAMGALMKISEYIAKLDLRGSGISDEQLGDLSTFIHLKYINLADNPLSDQGLKHLASLPKVETLVLHSTEASDSIFEWVTQMPTVKRVYLWSTEVSLEKAQQLMAKKQDLILVFGG